ncbi:transglycosylase SLT domain-containing protein [Methylobacterium sp. Leaf118]|uniref:transglycosylase SLT domain-containing protein n=1 Tax=Methylobacterium sp. Leaf118 TaxID=2876562 RepID=UPI001E4762A8|nr:transglycosylase SLT domain-containing protein [Methylobacterium sp. Leaf118]
MFLFTNAPVGTRETGPAVSAARPAATGGGEVVAAIREGAQTSGVGFDYLLATAQRESSLNPSAKAGTSSATGLFQFIEQTWLGVMKSTGAKLGLSAYADAITTRSDGTHTVADPTTRQAILDLRRDPRVSASLAGALTQRNREALGTALGREPSSGDLYAAHVLGARGAATLIGSAQASPARAAALDLPEAAAANKSLFYDRAGRPRSSSELYALLATATSGAATPVATAAASADLPTAYASLDGGLRTLFQTDRRQGAISDGVAKLWQGRAAGAETARTAPSYFPRSDGAEGAEAATPALEPAPAAASPVPILIPLPPRRPTGLSGTVIPTSTVLTTSTGKAASTGTTTAMALTGSPPAAAPVPAASKHVLFDLSSYRLRNGP